MNSQKQDTIPNFFLNQPYDIAYRKDCPSYPVIPHTHNAAELYLTLTSLPDVLLDNSISEVMAGSLIIIPPYCIHQLYHEPNVCYERYIFSVNMDWLKRVFPISNSILAYFEYGSSPLICALDIDTLHKYIDMLAPFLSTPKPFSLIDMADFFYLLDYIYNKIIKQNPLSMHHLICTSNAQKRINEIISYLNEHIYENISLKDLTQHFYLNPDYLSRLFKKHMHISLSRYIALQKMNHAQNLLREGKSITEIQEMLGYSSYAYFSKTFKKITGITPGQFKNQVLK